MVNLSFLLHGCVQYADILAKNPAANNSTAFVAMVIVAAKDSMVALQSGDDGVKQEAALHPNVVESSLPDISAEEYWDIFDGAPNTVVVLDCVAVVVLDCVASAGYFTTDTEFWDDLTKQAAEAEAATRLEALVKMQANPKLLAAGLSAEQIEELSINGERRQYRKADVRSSWHAGLRIYSMSTC